MRAKIFKARLFARAIVFMIIASLIFTGIPASGYAGVSGGDKLRTQAEAKRDGGKEIKKKLIEKQAKFLMDKFTAEADDLRGDPYRMASIISDLADLDSNVISIDYFLQNVAKSNSYPGVRGAARRGLERREERRGIPLRDGGTRSDISGETGKEDAAKIKTDYFRLEDGIYSVSGGSALDIMVDRILENSRQILKIPALKISFRKLSDNVGQVFWQFAGINIRRNFTFNTAPGKGADVNDIMPLLEEFEKNNLDLRKDEDYTHALAISAEKLTARGAVFNFVSDELLPAMRKELSESKRGREILETPSHIFIVPPNVFKKGGMRNIIRKVAELSEVLNIDFAFYGYKTEELNDILGIKNIIAAKSLDELLKGLANRNIEPANVMALIAPEDKDSDDSVKLKEAGVRQIVVPEITTLAMAKAIKEVFSGHDFVREAFNEFLSKALIEDKVILPINPDTQTKILEELKEGVFVFPEQVQPNPDVIKAIEEAVNTEAFQKFTEEFI